MTDLLYTLGAGLISGAFSAGVLWSSLQNTTRAAARTEGKIDDHIESHAKGAFK